MKRIVAFFLTIAIIVSSSHLHSDCNEYFEYEGDPGCEYAYEPYCGPVCDEGYACDPCTQDPCDYGCGYRSSISTPSKFLCVFVFAALIGAVIAIGIKDSNGTHSHY